MTPDRITIVVLTHNRRDELLANLATLIRQTPGVPVIVVDNGSRDGTADAVAAAYPAVQVVRAPTNLGAAGRNLGVAAAATPYVAFCDDDTCWETGSLTRAQQVLDTVPRAGVLSACVRVGPDGRTDPTCEIMARSPLGRGPAGTMRLLGFMAGACIFRRTAFLEAGGYEPRFFIGGEEALLALDLAVLGWEMLYAAQIHTWHHPSRQRDGPLRRHLLRRNAIWTAWLRLPVPSAWAEAGRELRVAWQGGSGLRVAAATLRGALWVWGNRRQVPDHIEQMRRRVVAGPLPSEEKDAHPMAAPE